MTDRALSVARSGALTTVQDLGRPGHAHLGVPRSGALDGPAAALANRLVGNRPEAAVLETTLNGCAVRPRSTVTVAVTGAPCRVSVDGRPAAWGAPVRVPAGALLTVGTAVSGLRSYVAVSGGITVEPVLGSRSTDLLSGLGPAPSRTARYCPWAPRTPSTRAWTRRRSRHPRRTGPARHAGPPGRLVHPGSGTGLHLPHIPGVLGEQPHRPAHGGARPGAEAQWRTPQRGHGPGRCPGPPDGRPVVFLADHPTTGGYPVIGVVRETDLPAVAQAAPGTPVRFIEVRRR